MRLLAIEVWNYRVHAHLRVELDPRLTVIAGPNESGKSTLIEAAHRALFLKARASGVVQEKMLSTLHGKPPEVRVEFETEEGRHEVRKRFSGNGGSATLRLPSGETLHGDEAEERLAELLGAEACTGGQAKSRLKELWAHLWILQGDATSDPSAHANAQRDELLARLQALGGGVVLQSALDSRVAARVREEHDEVWTKKGAKSGSRLATATAAEEAARAAMELARGRKERLDAAAADFARAEAKIAEEEAARGALRKAHAAAEERNRRVLQLKETEGREAQALEHRRVAWQRLDQEERDLLRWREEKQRLEQAQAPRLETLERAQARLAEAQAASGLAQRALDDVHGVARSLQLRLAAVLAFLEWSDANRQCERAAAQAEDVRDARSELHALDTELARLPGIDAKALKRLGSAQRAAEDASVRLAAMSASIERVSGEGEVRIGGALLAPGEQRTVADVEELRIDAHVLRIRPGGGDALEQARTARDAAAAALREALERAGVASLPDAERAAEARVALGAARELVLQRLHSFEEQDPDAWVARARAELEAKLAERKRREERMAESDLGEGAAWPPADESAATAERRVLEERLEQVQGNERERRQGVAAAQERLGAAREALEEEQARVRSARDEIVQLAALEKNAVERRGEDATRSAALAAAAEELAAAKAALVQTRNALEELQPEATAAEAKRLARTLEQSEADLAEARERRAAASGVLQHDGRDVDPRRAFALAEAEWQRAREEADAAQAEAEALRRLKTLFDDEQGRLAREYTRPLEETIGRYAQRVFGPRANVALALAGDRAFGEVAIARGTPQPIRFDFDGLSGGTKEQLAAAVRLGMAEVLAQTHGGCLPIVLDESFAYSDPERMEVVLGMLDLAAERGLQVVVLTSDARPFRNLGARGIELRPPALARTSPATQTAPTSETSETSETSSTSAARSDESSTESGGSPAADAGDDDERRLLAELDAIGGASGNGNLRERLGWDEQRYFRARQGLVERGVLTLGRGRGGSVRRSESSEAD